jgi:hypothetical protein
MPSPGSNDLLSAIRGFGGTGAGGLRRVEDEIAHWKQIVEANHIKVN